MRIEDEIKQKQFKSEYEKLLINLIFTSNWLSVLQQRFFKSFGITPQQYNVLRILRGQNPKPASVGMVQERMLDKSSNITRLVDKLIEKNLVTRCENPENRRMQELRITEKGLLFLEEISSNANNGLEPFQKLNLEEAQLFNDMLDRIRG
ncbi:MAG TPA: MarR family transcriptional regulator [Luteibaculaceae bacterium]|nr:MarR family transcriptional regulator [Luteibaculaceae bacterium]